MPRHCDRSLETRPTGPPLLLPPRPLRPLCFWFRGFSVPRPPVANSGLEPGAVQGEEGYERTDNYLIWPPK